MATLKDILLIFFPPDLGPQISEINQKLDTVLLNENSIIGNQAKILQGIASIEEFLGVTPGTLSAKDQAQLDAILKQSADVATQAASIKTTPPTG